jgi:hypothetical protein
MVCLPTRCLWVVGAFNTLDDEKPNFLGDLSILYEVRYAKLR